jgi:membrane-associated phospholipid phosphatase
MDTGPPRPQSLVRVDPLWLLATVQIDRAARYASSRSIASSAMNPARNRRHVRVVEVAAVLGGSALLAGSWVVVAATRKVPEAEQWMFELVNDLPDLLWPIVWVPMQTGSMVGSLIVVTGTAVVSRNRRLTLATLVASQVAYWSVKAVKDMVSRGRPSTLLQSVHLREHAAGLGYASGHTAVAFALATVLAPSLPRVWRPLAFGVACIVGFGRMYSGAHLPLDVVGGAGLGILIGTLTRWAFGLGGEGMPATANDSAHTLLP